jgi:hypothetical protein
LRALYSRSGGGLLTTIMMGSAAPMVLVVVLVGCGVACCNVVRDAMDGH